MSRAIAVVALLAVLADARLAVACSCAPTPTTEEAYADSPVVALIRVTRVEDHWSVWRRVKDWFRAGSQVAPEDYYRDYGFRVTAQVLQQWKGAPHRSLSLITGRGFGDCGYRFQSGQTYLVYPYRRSDGLLVVSICRRTVVGLDAGSDIQSLDRLSAHPAH